MIVLQLLDSFFFFGIPNVVNRFFFCGCGGHAPTALLPGPASAAGLLA